MNYSTVYPENELLAGLNFCTFVLLRRFSVFYEILTSAWLDHVIQSAAPNVKIKCEERERDGGFIQI